MMVLRSGDGMPAIAKGALSGVVVIAALGTAALIRGVGPERELDPEPARHHRALDGWRAGPATRQLERVPGRGAIDRAADFARTRGGLVSFATIDSTGQLHSARGTISYPSASLGKAMVLAAYLRRLEAAAAPLTSEARQRLTSMITWSDNKAADALYPAIGDPGMLDVARRARMRSFVPTGYWSEAQVTADDMARLMWRLRTVLGQRYRELGMRLLAHVIPAQRWGIPDAAGPSWHAWFKGGWREAPGGQLVHQAALLRGGGQRVAIAVLTDAQPSQAYGVDTIRGIAARLLGTAGRS
jgi:Beta-lactamase enzyme family